MNLFRIVTGVAKKILPKILAPLATGAVSGLGETTIKKAVGGSYKLSPEHVKVVVNTLEIREQIKRLLPVSQRKKLVESYKCGSGLVLKTGCGQKRRFSWKFVGRNRNSINCKVVWRMSWRKCKRR